MAALAKRQRITIVTYRAVRLGVDAAILGILAYGYIYRLAIYIAIKRKFQRCKRCTAKIYKRSTLIRAAHLHGQITFTHLRTKRDGIGLQLISRAEHMHR